MSVRDHPSTQPTMDKSLIVALMVRASWKVSCLSDLQEQHTPLKNQKLLKIFSAAETELLGHTFWTSSSKGKQNYELHFQLQQTYKYPLNKKVLYLGHQESIAKVGSSLKVTMQLTFQLYHD